MESKTGKIAQYKIFKIDTDTITGERKVKGKKNLVIKSREMDLESASAAGEVVTLSQCALTRQIALLLDIEPKTYSFINQIVNVHLPDDAKKDIAKKQYKKLAENGFTLIIDGNKESFVRFSASAGGLRNNSVIFINKNVAMELKKTLLCGLTESDISGLVQPSKYTAYMGLCTSSVNFLSEELSPRFIIVDDYEELRPHIMVNHCISKDVSYITTEDQDVVITSGLEGYEYITDGKTQKMKRISDGELFELRTGTQKIIEQKYYDEIKCSPCNNSFDGQGLCSLEWARKVGQYLGLTYTPSELIIRAPFIKGLVVSMDFSDKGFFGDKGITEVYDIFNIPYKISEIDMIITKSQFKMFKPYCKKFGKNGEMPYNYNICRKDSRSVWGIARVNPRKDAEMVELNYQFVQALMLSNDQIVDLCAQSEEFLREINGTEIKSTYNTLKNCEKNKKNAPLYQKIIEKSPEMIGDKLIREKIIDDCKSKFNNAKLSKLLINGNYQFIVSDPIAMMCHVARIPIEIAIKQGEVYSTFWRNKHVKSITALRSPYIDRNETVKLNVIQDENKYLKHLSSGLLISIDSLDALCAGGFDFDGDIMMSTDNELIDIGTLNREDVRGLYYELPKVDIFRLTKESTIDFDIAGFYSPVGEISNRATALYQTLEQYEPSSEESKYIMTKITALGELVGATIDKTKTGLEPTCDFFFDALYAKSTTGEADKIGLKRHNQGAKALKPSFMRSRYDKIDNHIKALDSCFKELAVIRFNKSFAELKEEVENKTATEEIIKFYQLYKSKLPSNDEECICNRIADHFTELEEEIKLNIENSGENLLINYKGDTYINTIKLESAKSIILSFKRNRQLRVKKYKTKSNNDTKSSNSQILSAIRNYYYGKLEDILEKNDQVIFDYLVNICDAKDILAIMDDKILNVLKTKE